MQPGERVEVAFTHNHWEAAHLASVVPLARGWERQLDEKANPLFYDGRPLTAARYHRWLRDSGVHWVALPDAPLDYSAQAEARLLEQRRAVSQARPPLARVAHLGGARPDAAGLRRGARSRRRSRTASTSTPRGPTVVRQRYTRWWRSGGACLSRAPGGWTRVTPVGTDHVRVRAGLRPGVGPDCSRPTPSARQIVRATRLAPGTTGP